MLNIVLVEPEIHTNTGNISRTCVCTGASLHLVRPLGFSVDSKQLRRAGLDYWDALNVQYYDNFAQVQETFPQGRFFFASTKARRTYADVSYQAGDFLVFGRETRGLPEELIEANLETAIRIPMLEKARSLNLSNAASIVLYEALRQLGFPNLLTEGQLSKIQG
ncbi:MAG: tRNA (cytidine(34)-2'-O)-methyltransferase [Acidobacteria bacterium]|nr:tRNA (cytidine(34)-2'-O)-methyltransferase [Acidobacteriota bacterium]